MLLPWRGWDCALDSDHRPDIAGPIRPSVEVSHPRDPLLGYQALFLAILSSADVRQMSRIFGHPFIKIHHVLSAMGLVLVTLHPLGVAINAMSLRVFVPKFDSPTTFFQLGRRPAWYLLVAASLAAVWRKIIGRNRRTIHFLNYVAFWLGTIHAIMIGTDFQQGSFALSPSYYPSSSPPRPSRDVCCDAREKLLHAEEVEVAPA